jgi:hypothetical protein
MLTQQDADADVVVKHTMCKKQDCSRTICDADESSSDTPPRWFICKRIASQPRLQLAEQKDMLKEQRDKILSTSV